MGLWTKLYTYFWNQSWKVFWVLSKSPVGLRTKYALSGFTPLARTLAPDSLALRCDIKKWRFGRRQTGHSCRTGMLSHGSCWMAWRRGKEKERDEGGGGIGMRRIWFSEWPYISIIIPVTVNPPWLAHVFWLPSGYTYWYTSQTMKIYWCIKKKS